ncbi:MAG: amidohydrolase family protein [Gemmatimonadales bacterium]|nr:amidohydrolase family protein [Gemmatimonadales bacterium]
MRIDVNTFVGAYPWRKVPATGPADLIASMDRLGIDEGWVTHLPGVFWRDPAEGNGFLYDLSARAPRCRPVVAVHPGLRHWEEIVHEAVARGAPAVRADPTYYGIAPDGDAMRALARECGVASIPLVLTQRFEDGRQRHPNDRADELPPWAVRALIRSHPAVRLLVTHADRAFIEEVHFGSTPEEAARIWWDICWVWGPPEDHLETLMGTIGAERFVFGTGQPLRLPENSLAKLDLLEPAVAIRNAIEHANVRRLAGQG